MMRTHSRLDTGAISDKKEWIGIRQSEVNSVLSLLTCFAVCGITN